MDFSVQDFRIDRDVFYALRSSVAVGLVFLAVGFPMFWMLAAGFFLVLLFLRAPFTRRDRIMFRDSKDGLDWSVPSLCIDADMFSRDDMAYHPCVIPLETGGWRMYHRGGRAEDRVVSAVSNDGAAFTPEPGVRVRGSGKHSRARFPYLVVRRGRYWLYYSSSYDGLNYDIHAAVSRDGTDFEPRGAVLFHGDSFDSVSASASWILPVKGGFRMYYNGYDGSRYVIATAFSKDGLRWRKEGPCLEPGGPNDLRSAANPCVVRSQGRWRMYYAGDNVVGVNLDNCLRGRSRQVILSAVSSDGLRWKKEPGIRVGTDRHYATDGVLSPFVLRTPEGWRMYYTAYWGSFLLKPFVLLAYGVKHLLNK